MRFQFYLEKLFLSEEFQKFMKEHPDAYPCSGFFVVDRENIKNPDNKNHFDYYVPSIEKMFSFKLEDGVAVVPVENFQKNPEKISDNYDFDFDYIEKLIEGEMFEQKIKNKIQKILISLQSKEGKDYLICTVFVSSMGLLRANIDIASMNITFFEKKSFLDMVNIFKKDETQTKGNS